MAPTQVKEGPCAQTFSDQRQVVLVLDELSILQRRHNFAFIFQLCTQSQMEPLKAGKFSGKKAGQGDAGVGRGLGMENGAEEGAAKGPLTHTRNEKAPPGSALASAASPAEPFSPTRIKACHPCVPV